MNGVTVRILTLIVVMGLVIVIHQLQGSGRVDDRMIKLATLGIPALLAITMLTSQSASANNIGGFDCYGQTDCVHGWNTAIGQATQDYNYNHDYNFYVYYWQQYCLAYHSYDYCSGYWHSYNYEWNSIAQQQNQQSNQQSNQQINIYNYGNGNTFNTGQDTSQSSDQEQNQSP